MGRTREENSECYADNTYLCQEKTRWLSAYKEKLEYYEPIRREYPEVITKDQFYRIAHISKATALFLLQSGKVPYKDSGKKHVGTKSVPTMLSFI